MINLVYWVMIIFSVSILTGCIENNNNPPLIKYSYEKPAIKILKIADSTKDKKMYQLAKTNLSLSKEKSTVKKAILLMKLKKLASNSTKN